MCCPLNLSFSGGVSSGRVLVDIVEFLFCISVVAKSVFVAVAVVVAVVVAVAVAVAVAAGRPRLLLLGKVCL